MSADLSERLRPRLYAWGRKTLPIAWRRKIRRMVPIERVFGIRKAKSGGLSPLSPDQTSATGRALVFLPVISWFYRWQRPQQLAAALALRRLRVFYAAPRALTEPAEEAADSCGVILLPFRSIRWEDPPDLRLAGKALWQAEEAFERYRNRFRFHDTALILETPFWEPLAVRLRQRFGWKVIYDCLDNYEEFAANRGSVLHEAEERLSQSADLLVASSPVLVEKLGGAARRPLLLPNACDFGHFSAITDPAPAGPGLRLGYFGALEEWFDTGLVASLARRRPNWTIDLIGDPSDEIRRILRGLPNVFLRGEKAYSELPSFMKEFDVVIIPHRLTRLTHAADHVKVYEALAAGRGVVATPSQTLAPLAERGLIRLAATLADFEREVLAAADEDVHAIARRRSFARENTWAHRASELDSAISALFAAEPPAAASRA